ncbi:hypothetical protein BH23BAC1_BH23BAC1_33100 [soil metagenome]
MDNNDLITRTEKAFNQHDLDALTSLFAENAIVRDPFYPSPLNGREEIRKDLEIFFKAFPDLKVKVNNKMVSKDWEAGEFEVTGTNNGPLESPTGTISPTNRQIKIYMSSFVRVNENGLAVENNRYYDIAGLFQQLGLQAEQV